MTAPIGNPRTNVTAILTMAGAVTAEQIEAGLARQRETGRRIGETLVELGFVSEEDIGWALARQLGITFVDVRSDALDGELIRTFPDAALRRLQVVPLVRGEGLLSVAIADPTDHEALNELERLAGCRVDCVAATPTAIEAALDAIFGHRPQPRPRSRQATSTRFDVLWERSGDTFLQFHVSRARRSGASEIHFITSGTQLKVMHRVGAALQNEGEEPAGVMEILMARLESLGLEPTIGHDSHQACSAVIEVDGREQAIEASLLVARDGPSVTIRLLRDLSDPIPLEALGLDAVDLARLRGVVHEPSGVILVCGPAGSGCSTTLASLLTELPTERRRWVVFARDPRRWPKTSGPMEIVTGQPVRRWRRVAVAHGADGLILDGGVEGRRVRDVIGGATHARWVVARTDWEDTFAMLEWLGRAPELRAPLAHRLRAVIQQRLVTGVASEGDPAPAKTIFEILFVTDAIGDALRRGADAATLREIAERDGFRSLAAQLRAGVVAGELDPPSAARAVA